jgi:hypothetical protein
LSTVFMNEDLGLTRVRAGRRGLLGLGEDKTARTLPPECARSCNQGAIGRVQVVPELEPGLVPNEDRDELLPDAKLWLIPSEDEWQIT